MDTQERLAFVMQLRARGIRSTGLLRALETIPRELFVPRRYADLAAKDVALPLACGQTMPSPFEAARFVEALDVQPHHRVLEIGTGSGYVSALLGKLAREVQSYERFQSLTLEAQARLASLEMTNVTVYWRDGLDFATDRGLFDRILVNGLLPRVPPALIGALAVNGRLVAARAPAPLEMPVLFAFIHDQNGNYAQNQLGPIRATALLEGISRGL